MPVGHVKTSFFARPAAGGYTRPDTAFGSNRNRSEKAKISICVIPILYPCACPPGGVECELAPLRLRPTLRCGRFSTASFAEPGHGAAERRSIPGGYFD